MNYVAIISRQLLNSDYANQFQQFALGKGQIGNEINPKSFQLLIASNYPSWFQRFGQERPNRERSSE